MKTPFVGWMMMPLTGFVIFAEGIGAENVAEPPTLTVVVFPIAFPSEDVSG